MPSLLGRFFSFSFRTERLIMNIIGLINSTFDWNPLKWTNQLEQIQNISLSYSTLILETIGEDMIKTVLSWIVIARIVIAHVYTFSYLMNIYSILTWSRPNLLLPWLILSFFKNVVLEVIVLAVCLLLWYDKRFSLAIFLEFVLVKVIPLILATYNWYSNSCLFLQLRHRAKMYELKKSLKSDMNYLSNRLYSKLAESKHKFRSLTTLLSYESYETYDTHDTISRIMDDPNLTPAQKTMKMLGLTQQDVIEARIRGKERAIHKKLTEIEDDLLNINKAMDKKIFLFDEEYEEQIKSLLKMSDDNEEIEGRTSVDKSQSTPNEPRLSITRGLLKIKEKFFDERKSNVPKEAATTRPSTEKETESKEEDFSPVMESKRDQQIPFVSKEDPEELQTTKIEEENEENSSDSKNEENSSDSKNEENSNDSTKEESSSYCNCFMDDSLMKEIRQHCCSSNETSPKSSSPKSSSPRSSSPKSSSPKRTLGDHSLNKNLGLKGTNNEFNRETVHFLAENALQDERTADNCENQNSIKGNRYLEKLEDGGFKYDVFLDQELKQETPIVNRMENDVEILENPYLVKLREKLEMQNLTDFNYEDLTMNLDEELKQESPVINKMENLEENYMEILEDPYLEKLKEQLKMEDFKYDVSLNEDVNQEPLILNKMVKLEDNNVEILENPYLEKLKERLNRDSFNYDLTLDEELNQEPIIFNKMRNFEENDMDILENPYLKEPQNIDRMENVQKTEYKILENIKEDPYLKRLVTQAKLKKEPKVANQIDSPLKNIKQDPSMDVKSQEEVRVEIKTEDIKKSQSLEEILKQKIEKELKIESRAPVVEDRKQGVLRITNKIKDLLENYKEHKAFKDFVAEERSVQQIVNQIESDENRKVSIGTQNISNVVRGTSAQPLENFGILTTIDIEESETNLKTEHEVLKTMVPVKSAVLIDTNSTRKRGSYKPEIEEYKSKVNVPNYLFGDSTLQCFIQEFENWKPFTHRSGVQTSLKYGVETSHCAVQGGRNISSQTRNYDKIDRFKVTVSPSPKKITHPETQVSHDTQVNEQFFDHVSIKSNHHHKLSPTVPGKDSYTHQNIPNLSPKVSNSFKGRSNRSKAQLKRKLSKKQNIIDEQTYLLNIEVQEPVKHHEDRKKQPNSSRSPSNRSVCECKMQELKAKCSPSSESKLEKKEEPRRSKTDAYETATWTDDGRGPQYTAVIYRKKPPVYSKKGKAEESPSGRTSPSLKNPQKARTKSSKDDKETRILKAFNKETLWRYKKELEAKRKFPSSKNSVDLMSEQSKPRTRVRKSNSKHRASPNAKSIFEEQVNKENRDALIEMDSSTVCASSRLANENGKTGRESNEDSTCLKLTKVNKAMNRVLDRILTIQKQGQKRPATDIDTRKQATKYTRLKKMVDEEIVVASSSKRLEGVQKGRELDRTPAKEDIRRGFPGTYGSRKQSPKVENNEADKNLKKEEKCSLMTIKPIVNQEVTSKWSSSTINQGEEETPLEDRKPHPTATSPKPIPEPEEVPEVPLLEDWKVQQVPAPIIENEMVPETEETISNIPEVPEAEETISTVPEAPKAEETISNIPEAPKAEETISNIPEAPEVEETISNVPEAPETDAEDTQRPTTFTDFTRSIDVSHLIHGVVLTNANAPRSKSPRLRDIVDDNTSRLLHEAFSYQSMDSIFDFAEDSLTINDMMNNRHLHTLDDGFVCQPSSDAVDVFSNELPVVSGDPSSLVDTIPLIRQEVHDLDDQDQGNCNLIITIDEDLASEDLQGVNLVGFQLNDLLLTVGESLRALSAQEFSLQHLEELRMENPPLKENSDEEDDEEESEEDDLGLRFIKEDIFTDIRFPIVINWADSLVVSDRDPERLNWTIHDDLLTTRPAQLLNLIESEDLKVIKEESKLAIKGNKSVFHSNFVVSSEPEESKYKESEENCLDDLQLPGSCKDERNRPMMMYFEAEIKINGSQSVEIDTGVAEDVEEAVGYKIEEVFEDSDTNIRSGDFNNEEEEIILVGQTVNLEKIEKIGRRIQLRKMRSRQDEATLIEETFKLNPEETNIVEIEIVEEIDGIREDEITSIEEDLKSKIDEIAYESDDEDNVTEDTTEIQKAKPEMSLIITFIFWITVFWFFVQNWYRKLQSIGQSSSTLSLRPFDVHSAPVLTAQLVERIEQQQEEDDLLSRATEMDFQLTDSQISNDFMAQISSGIIEIRDDDLEETIEDFEIPSFSNRSSPLINDTEFDKKVFETEVEKFGEEEIKTSRFMETRDSSSIRFFSEHEDDTEHCLLAKTNVDKEEIEEIVHERWCEKDKALTKGETIAEEKIEEAGESSETKASPQALVSNLKYMDSFDSTYSKISEESKLEISDLNVSSIEEFEDS